MYVNRTLQGQVIPVNPGGPQQTVDRIQRSTGAVTVEHGDRTEHGDYTGHDLRDNSGRFQSNGAAEYTESTVTYLRPGEYDEADARSLDYQAMEALIADALSCGGQVHIISPDFVASHLSPEDARALAEGKPEGMADLARKIGADVLVQVQSHPTRQTGGGLQVLAVAEAVNVRGGESIGHAVVPIPLPLQKTQLNEYTRFISRKLMQGMGGAWNSYAAGPQQPDRPRDEQGPPPAPQGGVPPAGRRCPRRRP